MKIYNNLDSIPKTEKGIITIGTFDGFHRGHIKIIDQLLADKKKEKGYETFVITFTNHPFEVIYPDITPKKLAPLDLKINFLHKKGIDNLILINFTKKFANITHHSFFTKLLAPFTLLKLVLGYNFRFGKGNKGDVNFLRCHEDNNRFFLDVVEKVFYEGHEISSSIIRELIRNGDIYLANKMLKREYYIEGKALIGDRIGKDIGFPTINIVNDDQEYPKDGVYKTKIEINNKLYSSMTFVGKKSIGNYRRKTIETNVFDFNQNVYDKKVKVYFLSRMRSQMDFNSLDHLKRQLIKDKKVALELNE